MSVAWQDRIEVRKGNAGERALDKWLTEQGIIPYIPITDGPHPFDRVCVGPDKERLFLVECKAKPARTFYPDTGIDLRVYKKYRAEQQRQGLHMFLVFVDEDSAEVYGQYMNVLDEPRNVFNPKSGDWIDYPLMQGGIRYWPLIAMRALATLTQEQTKELRALSTRRKRYTI